MYPLYEVIQHESNEIIPIRWHQNWLSAWGQPCTTNWLQRLYLKQDKHDFGNRLTNEQHGWPFAGQWKKRLDNMSPQKVEPVTEYKEEQIEM